MQVLTQLFRQTPASAVGLDLSDDSLCWVELRRDSAGRPQLERCLFEPLAPGWVVGGQLRDFGEVEAALRRLGQRAGADSGGLRPLGLAVPAQLVTTHEGIFSPGLSDEKLALRVQADLASLLRCSPEELRVDFRPARVTLGAPTGVVLGKGDRSLEMAAVSNEAVEDRVALVEAAGLSVQPVLMAWAPEAGVLAAGRMVQAFARHLPAVPEGSGSLVACGLALRAFEGTGKHHPDKPDFNFLPHREARMARRHRLFLRQVGAVAAIILVATAALRLALSSQLSTQQAAQAALRQSMAALDADAKREASAQVALDGVKGREAVLSDFDDARQQLPWALDELKAHPPEGLHLSSLRRDDQGYWLSGQARSAAVVFELMDRMSRGSQYFKQPTLLDLTLVARPAVAAAEPLALAGPAVSIASVSVAPAVQAASLSQAAEVVPAADRTVFSLRASRP